MPEEEKVKLFVSSGCGPCQEVKRMVEEGRFNLPDIEVIDITSEAGFPFIEQLGLTKVPIAFKGTKQCKIMSDEESLIFDCGENDDSDKDEAK